MSIKIEKDIINYGENTSVTTYNLKDVYIEPANNFTKVINNSLYSSQYFTYDIILQPSESTNYTLYGFNSNNQKVSFEFIIYINIILNISTITINLNDEVLLRAFGSVNYTWTPNEYIIKNNNSSILAKPLNNISYIVESIDQYNHASSASVNIIVLDNLAFTPDNPTIYEGDLMSIIVSQENNIYSNMQYKWRSTKSFELPLEFANITYGNELTIHPFFTVSYVVEGSVNNELKARGFVEITVLEKPSKILDREIIPVQFYNDVINRNVEALKKNILTHPKISQKVLNFYYNILTNAYRMEFTDKVGGCLTVPWRANYNEINKINNFIVTFTQQWNLYAYINRFQRRQNITISNYAFLLNTINNLLLNKFYKIN